MISLIAIAFGAMLQNPMGHWGESSPSWHGPTSSPLFGIEHRTWLVPDLDGDGLHDVAVGGPNMDSVGGGLELRSSNTGLLLLQINGGSIFDLGFGSFVESVPDQDFDGKADLLVSVLGESFSGGSGVVHLISSSTGLTIRRFEGIPGDELFGIFTCNLGDISGDGIFDFAVSMLDSNRFPLSGGGVVAVSGIDGSEIYQFQSLNVNPGLGGPVGDVNLDGFPDIIHGGNIGTYLHSGLDGTVLHYHPAPRDNEGFATEGAIADLGDINCDGIPDYAIGAADGPIRRTTGHVYVYDGASGAMILELSGIHLDSRFGHSVSSAGDVDGDGYPDIIVGAPDEDGAPANEPPGAARIFSSRDGTLLHVFRGKAGRAIRVGTSVLGVGDLDGNGLDEVLIGSKSWAGGGIANGVWQTHGLQSYLNISPQTISASAGGTLTFDLDFPDEMANQDYMILASNDAPGRTGFYSVQIPLARNPFLNRMVLAPPAWLSGANGTLDAFGNATATATLTPGLAAPFANRTIRFSAVTFASPLDASNYSAGMRVRIEN